MTTPDVPFCSETLKQYALDLGFAACGIARAEAVSEGRAKEFRCFLAEGRHGEMGYLANHVEKRLDPRLLVEGARSVVSVAMNYFPGDVPPWRKSEEPRLHLARYACATDYHEVVRQKLRLLMAEMGWEEPKDARTFVDTAPIDEKYWAERAGLGWRGRHSQLIIPGAGSYFFLGEIVALHESDAYDKPVAPRCGNCRACLDACPAGALREDGTMDVRRCLSYLTIEHRGELPPEAPAQMGSCFYGCDRCAEVCPHNRAARPTTEPLLVPRPALLAMTDKEWRSLSVERYRELFTKSAVKRAKYEGLMRNIKATGR